MATPRHLAAILVVVHVVACGSTELEGDPDGAADPDAAPPGCEEEVAAVTAELGSGDAWACTAVVRLDYLTYEVLGWETVCGEHGAVTEEEARETAAGVSCMYASMAETLGPSEPDDLFVFYQPPGDFGCIDVVSADTGLRVFGASIVWMGGGEIQHPEPTAWKDPAGLGSGCPAAGGAPSYVAYDTVHETEMTAEMVEDALDVVLDTALPAAFLEAGALYHAVVLRYARSVGMFRPETAEWIVFLNGGAAL